METDVAEANAELAVVKPLDMIIDGEHRPARSGLRFVTTDPATGRELARGARGSEDDVEDAVMSAERAFEAWRRVPAIERAALLDRLADAVEQCADELAMLD